jgi:hydrogenase maturation protease
MKDKILVAGIGNLLMGDDAFGPRVIEALEKEALPMNVELRDMGTAGLTIATDLEGYDAVVFVDSMDMEGEPGRLHQFRVDVKEITPTEAMELSRLTVHEVGLEGLLKFSKAIGTLPDRVFIIGCKPERMGAEFSLSPKVRLALPEAVERIKKLLGKIVERVS